MLAWVVLLQHLTPKFEFDKQWAIANDIYISALEMNVQNLIRR